VNPRQAADTRRVLRALAVSRTVIRDLPEVIEPAHRLDIESATRLHLQPVLPPSWTTRLLTLMDNPND